MVRKQVWLVASVIGALVLGACGSDSSDGSKKGGSGHTGTITLTPTAGAQRHFVFDKEIYDGCTITQNDIGCHGGVSWKLSAIGSEIGGGEIGVDFFWCGPSEQSGAVGTLQVDLGIGGNQAILAYLDEGLAVDQRGTSIKFSVPYDHNDVYDAGMLDFEADCSRGGISGF